MCVKISALQSSVCQHYQNQSSHQKVLNLFSHSVEPSSPRTPDLFRAFLHCKNRWAKHKPSSPESFFESLSIVNRFASQVPSKLLNFLKLGTALHPTPLYHQLLASIFTARTFERIWIPSSFEPSMHFDHLCLSFCCILKLLNWKAPLFAPRFFVLHVFKHLCITVLFMPTLWKPIFTQKKT